MKKIISTAVLCLLLISSVLALTSCGSLENGKYKSSSGSVFEIDGDYYIITESNVKAYAKYAINDNRLTLTFDKLEFVGSDDDRDVFNENYDLIVELFKANVCRTYTYEKVDGGIKLDGVKFTKQ